MLKKKNLAQFKYDWSTRKKGDLKQQPPHQDQQLKLLVGTQVSGHDQEAVKRDVVYFLLSAEYRASQSCSRKKKKDQRIQFLSN